MDIVTEKLREVEHIMSEWTGLRKKLLSKKPIDLVFHDWSEVERARREITFCPWRRARIDHARWL